MSDKILAAKLIGDGAQEAGLMDANGAALLQSELGVILIDIMTAIKTGITPEVIDGIKQLPLEFRPILIGAIREMNTNGDRLIMYLESPN